MDNKINYYKKLDLFGNEELVIVNKVNTKKNLFSDYDKFVDKFEVKKTTDDCYTPNEIYDIIIDYVKLKIDLSNKIIIRPFYPGCNYEVIDYPSDCIVIDNPPFSIITKICKFYIEKNIKFFLFAPHMTLFTSNIDCTHVVASADIIYENGAIVKTSFLSNIYNDIKIIAAADLYEKIKQYNNNNKVNKLKYKYPKNILTVSDVSWLVERGISFEINKKKLKHIKQLQNQKLHKKAIFGSGFLLSNSEVIKRIKYETIADEQKTIADEQKTIEWQLSSKELLIISELDND